MNDNQNIRIVPKRKGFYLVHKKDTLAGPFKTSRLCYEAKQEWVFGHYSGKVN